MQVLTGKEEYVIGSLEKELLQANESAFSPTCEIENRIMGSTYYVTRRLMPGYIFIRTEDAEKLYLRLMNEKSHHSLQTMTKLLKTGETFTPLHPEEEQMLLSLFGQDHHAGISTGVIINGKLQVTEGPLKGLEDKIVYIDRHKHLAALSLKIGDRRIRVKVALEVKRRYNTPWLMSTAP